MTLLDTNLLARISNSAHPHCPIDKGSVYQRPAPSPLLSNKYPIRPQCERPCTACGRVSTAKAKIKACVTAVAQNIANAIAGAVGKNLPPQGGTLTFPAPPLPSDDLPE